MGEFESRSGKTKYVATCSRFLTNFKSTDNMLHFFYKITLLIRSANRKFFFFHETLNSYNLETANRIDHVIFVLHSAMKTELLTNQNVRTIQIISQSYITNKCLQLMCNTNYLMVGGCYGR